MREVVAAASVYKLCGETFAVSSGTLAVPGERVIRLLDASSHAAAEHRHRIECGMCGEREFLFRSQRGGVVNITCIEIWQHATDALLFLRSYLLSSDQIPGTDGHLKICRRNR